MLARRRLGVTATASVPRSQWRRGRTRRPPPRGACGPSRPSRSFRALTIMHAPCPHQSKTRGHEISHNGASRRRCRIASSSAPRTPWSLHAGHNCGLKSCAPALEWRLVGEEERPWRRRRSLFIILMCSVLLVGSVSVPPVFKPANTAAAAPPMGSPVAETAVASATAETSAVADATTPALATDTATPAPTASVLATATGTITDATTPPTLAVCRREAGSPSRAWWYSRKHE